MIVQHQIHWHGYTINVRHSHPWCAAVPELDHLDITVLSPERAAIPITETGYRSHFLPADALIMSGGVVAYVTAWLDEAAKDATWQAHREASRQLSLF